MLYLQNTTDGLYYPVSLVDTGDSMTLVWDTEGGLPSAPPYVPTTGEPLISESEYRTIFNLSALDVPLSQWTYIALNASDAVEAYCGTSWRIPLEDPLRLEDHEDYGTQELSTPPTGLQVVVAQIIRATLGSIGVSSAGGTVTTPGLKSESLRNYSYTMADEVDLTAALNTYEASLRPYRQLYVGA